MKKNKLKIAILQRVCTTYRVPLFRKLSTLNAVTVKLFVGENLPNSKVKNAIDLNDLDVVKLSTKYFNFNGRILIFHGGLMKELIKYKPDVIICEGESNIHSLVKAIVYRNIINRKSRIIHWSLGGLPGEMNQYNYIRHLVKKTIHLLVDKFLVYSTYGKRRLIEHWNVKKPVGVAVNVSNVEKFIDLYGKNKKSRFEYRKKYNLSDSFTVLYVGDFSPAKRIEVIIDTARILRTKNIKFILIGSGPELSKYKKMAINMSLDNVSFTGHISNGLFEYYIASDAFMLPGRGGMVISEAMSLGLPVLAYQADGTEYDLVKNNKTGTLVTNGSSKEFADEIVKYTDERERVKKMGEFSNRFMLENFTSSKMINSIITLINC